MTSRHHLLVIDPTAFAGGSKIATENILRLLDKQMRITVLSADRDSWGWSGLHRVRLWEPKTLARQEQGIFYFLRHLHIGLQILIARLRYGRFDVALGASGPGVDLALYLTRPLLGHKIVQLIHGPVARSRTIGRCLKTANQVFYLESSRETVIAALSTLRSAPAQLEPQRFQKLQNGLPANAWPSLSQKRRPVIFWAASLLKWKGLDTLLDALGRLPEKERPDTHICYIRPKQTSLPTSRAPVGMTHVYWHEAPENLDKLRAGANIFVSTSHGEPFGLSILEAMAAGHCIVIPADGAFWDRTLIDGVDCIKYQPDDPADLAEKLRELGQNLQLVRAFGAAAASLAKHYRAESCYAPVKEVLERLAERQTDSSLTRADTEVRP